MHNEYKKFYPDHAQRYPRMSEDERDQYPDEVFQPSWGWIKREKTFVELCAEPKGKRYPPDIILLAAKDVPLCQAVRNY